MLDHLPTDVDGSLTQKTGKGMSEWTGMLVTCQIAYQPLIAVSEYRQHRATIHARGTQSLALAVVGHPSRIHSGHVAAHAI